MDMEKSMKDFIENVLQFMFFVIGMIILTIFGVVYSFGVVVWAMLHTTKDWSKRWH